VTTQLQPSDRELWASCRDGDGDAFGRLFDRHARAVYNHAFRLTGSWAAAEDITQATFLVAWRRRAEVEPAGGAVLPWLLVVAGNTAPGEGRALRRRRALLHRVPPPPDEADPADEVAARLDDEHRMRAILRQVRRLPRAQREAVALCLWSGLSYVDAAAAVGVAPATMRSRVSRARARLGTLLQEEEA
jgi:RNA polymerase sigma factor (sigma-70 family)